MSYESDDYDEDDQSREAFFDHHARNVRHNRGYDGSLCFCKPCAGCYGVWVPPDCMWGVLCEDCNPTTWSLEESRNEFDTRTVPDSTSDICAFLRRNARAHWRLVRWCVLVRPWALHWLRTSMERRYDPERLVMEDELASALGD